MDEIASRPQEIILTRWILTPPARIYAAFTRAEDWCAWCCEKAEVDAQIGGKLHIFTEGYNAYGEFTILEPESTVAFTWNGDGEQPTQIHISLHGQDCDTLMEFRVTGLGSAHDWAGFAGFLEHIWGHALDNLKTVLEKEI